MFGALVIAGLVASSPVDVTPAAISGVYNARHEAYMADGQRYAAEDILEIVKVSDTTAYFRLHLEFNNGHMCDLSGVGDFIAEAMVYRGPLNSRGDPCNLSFSANAEGIVLTDANSACRDISCGARGGYGHGQEASFKFSQRRPIRYLARLKASKEYAGALREYRKTNEPRFP